MLSPQRLAVFREVAERGSFTAAADALSYTQSAISQQISALERETGAILIERARKRVRLTQAGELLLDHADAILGRIASAEQELSAYVHARSGRLRLAAFESAGAALVPAAVETFYERYPGIELKVVQMEPEEACARLERRQLDLAVVYDLEPATRALGNELALTYLFDDRYTAVISKQHRLAGKRTVALRELAGEVWINTTERDLCHEVILGACRAAGFEPNVAFEVERDRHQPGARRPRQGSHATAKPGARQPPPRCRGRPARQGDAGAQRLRGPAWHALSNPRLGGDADRPAGSGPRRPRSCVSPTTTAGRQRHPSRPRRELELPPSCDARRRPTPRRRAPAEPCADAPALRPRRRIWAPA